MLTVDEHQFEIGYAPIACGLQILVVGGCVLASVLAILWFFLFRG